MRYYSAKEIATGKKCLVAKEDFDELPREKAIQSLLDMGIEVDTNQIIIKADSIFDELDCWDAFGGDWQG